MKEKIKESEGKFAKKNPYHSKNSNLLLKSAASAYAKIPIGCKNRSSTPQNLISNGDVKGSSRGLDILTSTTDKNKTRPNSVTARTGKLVAAMEGIQTSRNLYLQKLEETKNKEAALENADLNALPTVQADSKEILTRLQKSYSSKRITFNDPQSKREQKIKFKGYTNKNLVLPRKTYQMADIEKKASTT